MNKFNIAEKIKEIESLNEEYNKISEEIEEKAKEDIKKKKSIKKNIESIRKEINSHINSNVFKSMIGKTYKFKDTSFSNIHISDYFYITILKIKKPDRLSYYLDEYEYELCGNGYHIVEKNTDNDTTFEITKFKNTQKSEYCINKISINFGDEYDSLEEITPEQMEKEVKEFFEKMITTD